ncbi:MAG: Exopolyphosphatase [Rhodocyclaceae bacterium]|nr:Ppx/GppA family phosphatase [Rhodocyclaceae bacterium]MCG3186345.1 Exopolyphosphatase [Rhodocyclaceae bacterium]
MEYELLAAVDLGSNSFRLQVGRVVGDQIYPLDGLREPVRIAAGLTPQKMLDGASQLRATEALRRFNERLRGFEPGAVRAVGTNTFRVAKNAAYFLLQAEAALGFPIEVIGGREEARLIYLGVAHTLPRPAEQQLVVDIGGGSTEFIIGANFVPQALESLYVGCVGYSLQFFRNGQVDKRSFADAVFAARREIQTISQPYRELGWDEAIGTSGSFKAILDLVEAGGWGLHGVVTREALERLRGQLIRAGHAERLGFGDLRADRVAVLPGGLSILIAVFEELGLSQMSFSEGALRLGVLYDLLGRYHHHDLRDATVAEFQRRYQVDRRQAERVATTGRHLLTGLLQDGQHEMQFLSWAGLLHEIGISVAHTGYHKHSAYILANADMPGFSRMDQGRLARVVLAHRGKLERVQAIDRESRDWLLILALRVAAILHRARQDIPLPSVSLARGARAGFVIEADHDWLAANPLTAASLSAEIQQWAQIGFELSLRAQRKKKVLAIDRDG